MQLSLFFSLASLALSQAQDFDVKQNFCLPCAGKKEHHDDCGEHKAAKPCLFGKCPGACICGSHNKERYPGDVCPEHEEQVITKVHVETGCVTDYKLHTSQETLTKVVNHVHTETAVYHPEQTFTLTRTESYVVWPAATSQVCGGSGHKEHKAPCAKHGKSGCGKSSCC